MDILLIERDPSQRVAIAEHMCRFGHRVTLTSSMTEAQELLSFVRTKAECPSAVLVGEDLLGRRSADFRSELAVRFPDLAWVPVRHDIDLDWLRCWLEQTGVRQKHSARRCLDILFVEPDTQVRREVVRRFSALGDRISACASIAEARREIDRPLPFDVLVAPVLVGNSETISLFLAAKKLLPSLRWIVTAEVQAPNLSRGQRPPKSTFSEIDRLRRSSIKSRRTAV